MLVTFELLRRKSLREKYAAIWILLSATLLLFALVPSFLEKLSDVVGFQISSNFFMLLILFFLMFVVMQLSLEVGKLEHEAQRLAEEISLMKSE
jgi:hypothetical protein